MKKRTGVTANGILRYDDVNKAFNKTDDNIAGVDWKVRPLEQEIQDPEVQTTHIKNNQYAALADDEDYDENEDNQENDTKSTGVENDGKITGVQHDDKITVVDSDNERMGIKSESGITGANDEADRMELIKEAVSEADRDIAEVTELLAGNEAETEYTRDENVIYTDSKVPTEEHTYNLQQRGNQQPDFTHRNGSQATIIHYALTQLSMERGLKKFKQKAGKW